MCGCLSCAPHWWPSSKLRHVPRLGIEPATPQFTGLHSVHQATPARADLIFLYNQLQLLTSPWHQGIKCIIVLIFLNLMSSVLRPHPSTWQEIKSQLLFKPLSSTESYENPRLTLSQELWEGAIFSPWMDVDFIPIHASPWSGCWLMLLGWARLVNGADLRLVHPWMYLAELPTSVSGAVHE